MKKIFILIIIISGLARNFIFMLSTAATAGQKDAAPYLWINRKYQVALSNLEARL